MVAETHSSSTGFVIRVPETIYQEMAAHVLAGYPNEACGALGSVDGTVVKNYPAQNVAEHPDDFSIISERDIVRIFNDIDAYDGEMIYYHSHPISEAYPSARDREWAKRSGYLYIIFSLQYQPEPPYARVFRIDPRGEVTEGHIERLPSA
ncbi:Mov34/MPN/PAD-1 family protein [Ktedonobacter racemifer]|uniref:Mov34/MPN/PAD-1 family protein n=1 Tax=Ktedonobacter racemifer DSM 44963 TaxID=485913 RepID=D6TNS2_KTERA|nr:M67 family metallopeptidase [Ktedonobacter racemifer]EFH85458.1 Mov34/MPN/PAD-1 family protein [Ktedonobacter racemifer DSM 44963]